MTLDARSVDGGRRLITHYKAATALRYVKDTRRPATETACCQATASAETGQPSEAACRSSLAPRGTDFIRRRLDGYRLHASIDIDDELRRKIREVAAFSTDRATRLRTGKLRPGKSRSAASKTGTALDNAAAWWRFFEPNDFLNHGTAGKSLDTPNRCSTDIS